MVQLKASKSSIRDLFKDLLDEIKGFKYQLTAKVLLRKHKINGDIEFAPVYFNSTTKTVTNSKYDLDKSFQEILYRIDNWNNVLKFFKNFVDLFNNHPIDRPAGITREYTTNDNID